MTKTEAIDTIKSHQRELAMLSMLMSLSGMEFGRQGEEIEKGLGLPVETLAKALNDAMWTTAMSDYLSVLQNAIDGKLVSEVDDEWASVVNAD